MNHLVNPDDLGPRAKLVLEYVFEHPKATNREIAQVMGISDARVSRIRKHPKFMAAFPSKARARAKALIPQAMGKLEALMEQTENLEVSRKVVADVLATGKVLENAPTTQINVFQTMSQDELMRKVDKIRVVDPDVIDTDLIPPTT